MRLSQRRQSYKSRTGFYRIRYASPQVPFLRASVTIAAPLLPYCTVILLIRQCGPRRATIFHNAGVEEHHSARLNSTSLILRLAAMHDHLERMES